MDASRGVKAIFLKWARGKAGRVNVTSAGKEAFVIREAPLGLLDSGNVLFQPG